MRRLVIFIEIFKEWKNVKGTVINKGPVINKGFVIWSKAHHMLSSLFTLGTA